MIKKRFGVRLYVPDALEAPAADVLSKTKMMLQRRIADASSTADIQRYDAQARALWTAGKSMREGAWDWFWEYRTVVILSVRFFRWTLWEITLEDLRWLWRWAWGPDPRIHSVVKP